MRAPRTQSYPVPPSAAASPPADCAGRPPAGGHAAALAALLPRSVVVRATDAPGDPAGLAPAERTALGRAAPRRLREFAAGRACARDALSALGTTPVPLLRGRDREPRWPVGVVGSITHCDGLCAAAAAPAAALASVGIDAEPHAPLPDGVEMRVAEGAERAWMHARAGDGVCWDRLLFSAKESVFKAWFPLACRWLGFEDTQVVFAPARGAFRARLLVAGPRVGGRRLGAFDGRFAVHDGFVLTAVAVRRDPAG